MLSPVSSLPTGERLAERITFARPSPSKAAKADDNENENNDKDDDNNNNNNDALREPR